MEKNYFHHFIYATILSIIHFGITKVAKIFWCFKLTCNLTHKRHLYNANLKKQIVVFKSCLPWICDSIRNLEKLDIKQLIVFITSEVVNNEFLEFFFGRQQWIMTDFMHCFLSVMFFKDHKVNRKCSNLWPPFSLRNTECRKKTNPVKR